jgi:POT family proton-dependent oligopeptide transporter
MKVTQKRRGLLTILWGLMQELLGIMLCGYIGEKISWSWGFGLAGIFMFFGMLQFYFTHILDIGLKPTLASKQESKDKAAKVNLANIVHDRIIAVLIFLFYSFLLGIV